MNNQRKDGIQPEAQSVYSVGSQDNLVPIKSRKAYFRRNNRASRLVVVILVSTIIALFVAVIVLSVLYMMLISSSTKVCDSKACVRIAASLKESMNTSIDPCDDFYKYVCGRWSNEHPIPDTGLTNSWFRERTERTTRQVRELLRANFSEKEVPWAVMQAKILYDSCTDSESMNSLGLTPLYDLLEDLELPIIPAAFTNVTNNFINQMANVKRLLGRDIFIGVDVIPDPRNKTRNVIILDVPITDSPFPGDKELEKRLKSIRSRLSKFDEETEDEEDEEGPELVERTYMTDAIKEIVSNGSAGACSVDDSMFPYKESLKKVVDNVYEMSGTLYYLSRSKSNQSVSEDNLKDDDYILVDDLQKMSDDFVTGVNSSLTSKVIWRPFLEALFKDIVELDLDKRDKVLVADIEYLMNAALLISSTEEEYLETTIWWTVVDIVAPHSSENLRKIWSAYLDELMNVEIGESRSLKCADGVNQLMGMAVSWLFVDPSFHQKEKQKVLEMLEDIRWAFASLVSQTDWMDKQTKKATLEKNQKMTSEIGFPKWLFEEGTIDEYYEGIDLSYTEYLDNMVQIVQLKSLSELELLHEENYDNESYWATDPTDVNAFHTFQENQITVPAGILQFPFYELGLEALNYGAIGTVLGHELTHGYDNSGRQYDGDGNLRQWWTNETISEYTDRTQCFIDHYSGYYEEEVDDYIDGELTLGENIADNGGLREAVIAYERWKVRYGREPLLPGFTHLTHEQLLFLGFGHLWCESYTAKALKWMLQDPHCPGHIRLKAVLRNSHEFSKAWKCPVGSNMNPSKKCRLW